MPPPRPRQMDSWQSAEVNAADWMRWWGHLDATVTPGGPDAGIDVQSSTALAQVKWEAAQTGAPALQRLVGARRMDHDKVLFFFSGAGYSRRAVDYADDMDIALFKFDLTGRPAPMSLAAHRVVLRHERETEAKDRARAQAQARTQVPGASPDPGPGASVVPRGLPGRGWLGRNYTLLAAAVFLGQAIRNGSAYLEGRAAPDIDQYDPWVSLVTATVLVVVWVATRASRVEWKRLRGAARAEQQAEWERQRARKRARKT